MWTDIRERLASGILRAGFDHWSSLTADETVPNRCAFDPSDMPPDLLPHTVMLEVGAEPLNFRYRVIGDEVLRYMGQNYTGQWLSDIIHQAPPSTLFETLAKAVEGPEPIVSDTPFSDPDQLLYSSQEVVLPLRGANGQVSRLLTFVEFASTEPDLEEAQGS